MQETTQKCADRISEALKSREEDIKFLMSSDNDEDYQQLCEIPLGIETVRDDGNWSDDIIHKQYLCGEILSKIWFYSGRIF